MFNNIYVVKDKVSNLMTSQLMVANNDLVAIKGFAESLKNVAPELALDSVLCRVGSISESGEISSVSSSGLFNNEIEKPTPDSVKLCDSKNYEDKFNELLEKYNDVVGED